MILGVDNDPVPLKLWSANVGPGGKAVVATLGSDSVELPPPAEDLHVHFSSTCTELSSAKTSATPEDVADGLSKMASMLDLVLERGDYSWSCEQVSVIKTRDLLSEYVAKFPDKVTFATFDAADFGAPYASIYSNATFMEPTHSLTRSANKPLAVKTDSGSSPARQSSSRYFRRCLAIAESRSKKRSLCMARRSSQPISQTRRGTGTAPPASGVWRNRRSPYVPVTPFAGARPKARPCP